LFGTLARLAGAAATVVPGLQPFAPYISAVGSLASGDPVGAVTSMVTGPIGDAVKAGNAGKAVADAAGNTANAALADPSISTSLTNVLQQEPGRGTGLIQSLPAAQESAGTGFANTFARARFMGGEPGAASVTPGVNPWLDVAQTDPRRQGIMRNILFNTRRR
jgi:hypothetical protein